jgi:hypothetical protein
MLAPVENDRREDEKECDMGNSSGFNGGEADNLLAGIFDDIADAAEREAEDTQKRVRSQQDALETNLKQEEELRRVAAATHLNAESERKNEVVQRRTARMQALEVEQLKAEGKWVDPEEADRRAKEAEAQREREREERRAELARQEAARPLAQARVPQQSTADQGVPWLPKLAGAIALVVVVLILALARQSGYEVDTNTYAKSFRTPTIVAVAALEMDTQMLPQETSPKVAGTIAEAKPATRARAKNRRRKSSSKPNKKATTSAAKKKQNDKADELEQLINSTDPFGSSL